MSKEISERQKEILESAAKLLTQSGISGLTIKNLAKKMNFSESAIYRHFTSKEEIILTMLDFVLHNVDKTYLAIADEKKDPVEKLKNLFESQFAFFQKNPHFAVAIFSDGLLEESKKINSQILKIMSTRRVYIASIMQEGQEKNIFTKKISTDEMIHIIMGSVRLQMYKWRISHFEYDITIAGKKLVESLLQLIIE